MADADVQLAATFAFSTYIGELLTSPQPLIAEQELALFQGALDHDLPGWEVVWGPVLYRFPITKSGLYDNFVAVARRDDRYVVAIRGTNGHAPLDWVFEDFWLTPEEEWARFAGIDKPHRLNPKMTHGTYLGVSKLLFLPARGSVPGQGQTLIQFLNGALAAGGDAAVMVTGHSLGGALAPTVALYLKDTQGRPDGWDPAGGASLTCVAFAGPTPGNADFARYLDQRLGTDATRVLNPLDIVPMAWAGLDDIAGVYGDIQHPVHPSEVDEIAIDAIRELLRLAHHHFAQYHESGDGLVTLGRITDHDAPSFMGQAGWQHVDGYESQLGIPDLRKRQIEEVYDPWCAANPSVCPPGSTQPK